MPFISFPGIALPLVPETEKNPKRLTNVLLFLIVQVVLLLIA